MPIPSDADFDRIDKQLETWQQGDIIRSADLPFAFVASAATPLSSAAQQTDAITGDLLVLVETVEVGFVILTQTCDVVRSCRDRPFLELAPLVAAPTLIEETRRLKRVSFAYHPAAARQGQVVDLDRTMTVEKAVVVGLNYEQGLSTTTEILIFQQALAAKRARFAFPDDFVAACSRFSKRVKDKAGRQSPEGQHLDALDEIRVSASDWSAPTISLNFWLVKRGDPATADWLRWTAEWSKLVDASGRFTAVTMQAATLDDMTARDHVESHHLDFDQLSVPARTN